MFPGFLNKNPADRLGCNRESGFVEIMTHAFFKTIDWALLEQKQIPPPYRPRLESERDLANFPPEFTDEPVHLTPDDPGIIGTIAAELSCPLSVTLILLQVKLIRQSLMGSSMSILY